MHDYNNAGHARNFINEVTSILGANPYYGSLLVNNEINFDAPASEVNLTLYTQLMIKLDKHFKVALSTMATKSGTELLRKIRKTYLSLGSSHSKLQEAETAMITDHWLPQRRSLPEFAHDFSNHVLTLNTKPTPPSFSDLRNSWIN